jgi:hypothetical protein
VTVYTYDELWQEVELVIVNDAARMAQARQAAQTKHRGWFVTQVANVARMVFGHVIHSVVERVVDLLWRRYVSAHPHR